jgi:ankyrin repeat protein
VCRRGTHGSGFSALHVACKSGAVCTARVLLDRGADVSMQSVPNGNTPLHIAACAGQEDIVRLLLMYPNIDVDLGNIPLGETPLIAASQQGHCLVVARLLVGGADCQKGYRKSPRQSLVTPLYAACRSGRLEVVRLLLAHISSHGIGTGTGPLRSACCNGRVEIVRALLDFGMSPFRKAVSGKTAFDYAHPHPPVARLLRPRILVVVRTCVLGTAAEYPCRNRLRDLVPHIASYVI